MNQTVTILDEEDNIVFNAKGDFNTAFGFGDVQNTLAGPWSVSVNFNSSGIVSFEKNPSNSWWVDTDGSDDVPVDNSPWVGASNYQITWGAPTAPLTQLPPTYSPTTAQTTPLSMTSFHTFSASGTPTPEDNVQWIVTIENIATGATKNYTVSLTLSSNV